MLKHLRTTLALLLLAFAGNAALAHGQAACRIELPFQTVCFAEQVAFSLGPIETTGGAEIRFGQEQNFTFVPYVALAWYAPDWFTVLEFRSPIAFPEFTPNVGFTAALTFGVQW